MQPVVQAVAPYIDGAFRSSEGVETFEVINPSSARPLMTISAGCEADANYAVASARAAFEDGRWCDEGPSTRKRVLRKLADLIETNSAQLDALDAEEMGKPIGLAYGNAASAASLLRFYAEAVDKVSGDVYVSGKRSFVTQRRRPRGVVAAVVPWNFPTANAVLKLGPGLAAGNSVVLKPSELSSRSAIYLGRLALEAGIPPGVFNVVPGLGRTVGRALALHGDVDMLAFTGSTAVGKQMLEYAGQSNMKLVIAECGGKSPHIICSDAEDLNAISNSVADLILVNQGQLCSTGSRVIVHRSIQSEVVSKILLRMRNIVMGDALDPKTTFGPLASAQQRDRVMKFIRSAESDEAACPVSDHESTIHRRNGYFVEPTVFRDVAPDAPIAQEEIFGPVLSVIPFDDEPEAIRIANGTRYGLAACVWTSDLSTALRMAKSINSTVLVNAAAPSDEGPGEAVSLEPFGQSGVGVEGGLAGMESYLRRQVVWFNHK